MRNRSSCSVELLESRQFLSATIQPLDIVRSIPFGGKIKAVFTDADGSKVTVSLKGPGSGAVNFDTDANADASSINLTEVTEKSSVSIKGDTTVASVSADGALRSFSGKTTDLTGAFTVRGSVKSIRLRTVSDATFDLGAGDSSTLVAGSVFDTDINAAAEIHALKVGSWFDNVAPEDQILTPLLNSLSCKGDFFGNVSAASVGKVKIGGTLSGDIRSDGDIVSISAAAIGGVSVFAGVPSGVTTLPTSVADFANSAATIRSFSVKGKFTGAFSGAQVAAPTIGKASLGNVLTDNSGTAFGLATDSIGSLSGMYDGSEKFKLKKLTDPSQSVTRNDLVIRML